MMDWHILHSSRRKFELELENADICLDGGHLMQLEGIEDLFLDGLQNMKNVLYGLDRDGFAQLKLLHVRNNSNLLCVVESTDCAPHNAFPILESLCLVNLFELEKICCGQLTVASFSNLKEINVSGCHKLKNIFSFSIAISLQRLQSIKVFRCKNMEEIFAVEGEYECNNNGDVIEFNQLHSLQLTSLPQLVSFCSELKTPSMLQQKGDESTTGWQLNEITSENDIDVFNTFVNKKVVLPNLKKLIMSELKCEKIWHNQLGGTSCCVQNLTCLILSDCHKLKYIFSSSMVSNLVQLQHLDVSFCDLLEEIVAKEREEESAIKLVTEIVANEGYVAKDEIVFNKLKTFYLSFLESLTSFCSGSYTFNFPSLEDIYVSNCPKMKIFCNGALSTPRLHRVFLNRKVCWEGDLNTMIQHFNKEKKIQDSGEPSTQHQE